MKLILKSFQELNIDELYDILQIRSEIFVVEQNCVYQDLDNLDRDALHLYASDPDGIQAYLRIMRPGTVYPDAAAIGRVLSRKRRIGLGSELLSAGIQASKTYFHASRIRLAAQLYARNFYEQAGFCACSDVFLEDGIPHIEMLLEL